MIEILHNELTKQEIFLKISRLVRMILMFSLVNNLKLNFACQNTQEVY